MSNRRGYKDAFLKGVNEFVSYAREETNFSNRKIRCPCSKWKKI